MTDSSVDKDGELPGMLAVAKGVAEQTWPHTMDAAVWAAEFVKRYPGSDEGDMLGWFANAIMAGYDTAYSKLALSSCPPVDRNAVLEEAATACEVLSVGAQADCDDLVEELIHLDCASAIRALKSAAPECAPSTNAAGRAVPEPVATAETNVGNSTESAPAAPPEGPTPRVDALRDELLFKDNVYWCRELGDLARQLERELAEAVTEHDEALFVSAELQDKLHRPEPAVTSAEHPAVAILRAIDATGLLYRHDMTLDAKVANYLSTLSATTPACPHGYKRENCGLCNT